MPWINFRSTRLEIRGIKSLKNRQIWKRAGLGNSLLFSDWLIKILINPGL
jgi:hypothetical protein